MIILMFSIATVFPDSTKSGLLLDHQQWWCSDRPDFTISHLGITWWCGLLIRRAGTILIEAYLSYLSVLESLFNPVGVGVSLDYGTCGSLSWIWHVLESLFGSRRLEPSNRIFHVFRTPMSIHFRWLGLWRCCGASVWRILNQMNQLAPENTPTWWKIC